MSLQIILLILLIHWVADFVLQTHWQATNKSTSNLALRDHVSTYTSVWFVVGLIAMMKFSSIHFYHVLGFCIITWVAHFITDYFTSRLNSYLWKKQDVHNFFVSIGFDQILHYTQLILTYVYLVQ